MNENHTLIKRSFKDISDRVHSSYQNMELENINDHALRMSVMEGEYRWHYHAFTDELFMVLEGTLVVETKDCGTFTLEAGEFLKIPRKTVHKTSAIGRSVNLTIEKSGADTVFVDGSPVQP